MGFGASLLKITSALSVIVSMVLVGVSAYVYRAQDPHIGQIALARVTVQGSLALGVLIFVLSVVGYWGASSKNRCLLHVFFALLQAAFAGIVVITTALYVGTPWIDQQLETLCKDHPWQDCTNQVPKIEATMRDHLYLVRSISLSICVFLLGIIHASFLAVSESRRSAYSEIPSYNKPQTFVVS
ncbi:hypothetical protein HKI87_09g57110 [Chloropicon roscoffensis]|uniref:Tetraspanin n=1 Tax=Chloropicon roscoffensis TaxID=1461544 RepID=A0A7S3CDN2_9CHLO|mmetsp:Transcript_5741/g.17303  ORF Transcript_5741/g.17303 Transcript_5741/m.17303 type:complete len:184 (+) Transcript_5741:117-668(+)